MSTTRLVFANDQLEEFAAELAEWPNSAWSTDEHELAVSTFTSFYFLYEPKRHVETSLRLVHAHEDYELLTGRVYKVATHPDSERPHAYGSRKLPDLREFARKRPLDRNFLFAFSDEENPKSSPATAGYFWRSATWGSVQDHYSYMQFYCPWQWWLDNKDAWRRFVLKTIDLLGAQQVYSGFSMANPLDIGARSEVAVWERSLALRFYGLDIDYPFGMARALMDGIRPPTWAFLLSNHWRERLGLARADVSSRLSHPRIAITDLQAGQWIELGDKPELYPVKDGVPELPAMLNRLVKPLRNDDLGLVGFGQWDGDPNERFDRTDSRRWLGRFDADSDWPSAELRTAAPPSPTEAASPLPQGVEAGQPCSQSGWWFTPAKVDSRRHFQRGEVVPAVGVDYGTTVWQWDPDQSTRS